jgi:starch synthase
VQSRKTLEHADVILTCNPNEAQLLRVKFPGKDVRVQPHGIPLALFETDCREAAQKAYPQIRNRRVLLCVGRIDPVKNQGWLLAQAGDVCRRHPDAVFIFVGACTDETYGNQLVRTIAQSNLGQKVLLAGGLPPGDARLIGLFQTAQAVLLPSISETFGLVLLEAWAAGTPVISSRTSGATALVRHGENGWLFDLAAPAEFHAAVDAAFAAPDLCKELAAAGRKLAARHGIQEVAGTVKGIYEKLINENHALRHSSRR